MSRGYPSRPSGELAPPSNLSEMLAAAETLSESFNYVRVDLYSAEDRLYFGELTFTPGSGLLRFDPVVMDEEWARLFDPDPSFFGRGPSLTAKAVLGSV